MRKHNEGTKAILKEREKHFLQIETEKEIQVIKNSYSERLYEFRKLGFSNMITVSHMLHLDLGKNTYCIREDSLQDILLIIEALKGTYDEK